jgi:hypothetical protein
MVGGFLTVLGQDSAVEVSGRIQQRLMDILQVELRVKESSRLQIRVCQHHELEGSSRDGRRATPIMNTDKKKAGRGTCRVSKS